MTLYVYSEDVVSQFLKEAYQKGREDKDRRIVELEEMHKQDLIKHERLERRNAELLAEVRE